MGISPPNIPHDHRHCHRYLPTPPPTTTATITTTNTPTVDYWQFFRPVIVGEWIAWMD